jgi:hypothetical protein
MGGHLGRLRSAVAAGDVALDAEGEEGAYRRGRQGEVP